MDALPNWYFSAAFSPIEDWQERPELQHILAWWRRDEDGVFALVGPGGAGKTTIVAQFIAVLSERRGDPGERTRPERLFAYSFYANRSLREFFAQLETWNTDARPSPQTTSAVWRRLSEARAGRCLIVLDGLEEIMDPSGSEGEVLAEFLGTVAKGALPGVSVVMTTRYNLFERHPRLADAPRLFVVHVGPPFLSS